MNREKTAPSVRLIVTIIVLSGLATSGCTTFTQDTNFATSYPASAQRIVERPAVQLHVEDAIADMAFKQDAKFLGEDTYERWLVYTLIPMGKDYRYVSDLPRTDIVRSVLQENFGVAGLPLGDQSGRDPAQMGGVLNLSVRVKTLAVSTTFSSLVPLLIITAINFHDEQADAVLEIQVTQPGSTKPLWQGTVSGRATEEELEKMESTARANIRSRNAWMVHEAIARAVQDFMTQSQIVQISTRLRDDAFAKALKPAQDAEAKGDLRAALSQYGRAYQAANSDTRATDMIKAVAQVSKKLNSPLVLPEEARRYGVQAGVLAEKKLYAEATSLYRQALGIAPWWAEGHFNRALLFEEQSRFSDAITAMQAYLELSPNGTDARSAQDKIYEWELKAK